MAIRRRRARLSLPKSRDEIRDPLLSILTLLLIALIFIVVPLHAAGAISAEGYGFVVVLLLASCALTQSRRWSVIVALLFGIGVAAAAIVLRSNSPSFVDLYLDAVATLIIDAVLIVVVTQAVFAPGKITIHRINGAVLLYLTIGMTFAGLFTVVALASPGAISNLDATEMRGLASRVIYFSFTTLTSVGYGDIVPVHPVARSLANLEAIVGQLFPATLLARLVTLELSERSSRS
ncbi:Ion transport 2 domain protein [Methylocella silvestris BL2]|uniref:Ion transport 2 domain protein n=1 Tax=Methylocella silvestris (strain DSM 15510 / CIP 108128 / LMG 27833 / NCIMB 13906 / BL2) TaxID=395965 RepID=B8ET27_METSB|nr:potassium channel family protein [Methylocella silvestris]ACK51165.1 Ion transport 2 domain protein [Methylocella silvestris BL2]